MTNSPYFFCLGQTGQNEFCEKYCENSIFVKFWGKSGNNFTLFFLSLGNFEKNGNL